LLFQVVNGGQHQSIQLELNDGTRLGLPLFVGNHEAMIAAINQHVTGNVSR
jgi:hypothetical protein